MTDPRPDPPPLPRATDKRGGYPGSGDGATMRPPAPIPSGYKTRGEQGAPTPYDAGLREGFRRALEGEMPWWPIPGNPNGEYRGSRFNAHAEEFHRMHERMEWLHKGMEAGYQSAEEDLGRPDPIRAVALQAAVDWLPTQWAADGTLDLTQVLQAAEKFAAWLVGGGQAEQVPIDPHPFVDQRWSTVSPSDSCHLATGPDRICGRRRDHEVHVEVQP